MSRGVTRFFRGAAWGMAVALPAFGLPVTHDWVAGHPAHPTRWDHQLNWAQGSQPDATSYLRFDTNRTSVQTVNLRVGHQDARGLYFTAGSFVLTHGTLRLGSGGLVNSDGNTRPVIRANVRLTDHQRWDSGAGGFEVTGDVNLDANPLTVEGGGTSRIAGAIRGEGGLTKAGRGLFTLSGPNTYSGETVVAGGLLRIERSTGSATGSGNVRVRHQAALGGSGLILGNLDILAGGIWDPGTGALPGNMEIRGDVTLSAGANFRVELYSATEYDHVVVRGGLVVDNATLSVTLSHVPALHPTFRISII